MTSTTTVMKRSPDTALRIGASFLWKEERPKRCLDQLCLRLDPLGVESMLERDETHPSVPPPDLESDT
jgi:hypothetical protein